MLQNSDFPGRLSDELIDQIADALATDGWIAVPMALPTAACQLLRQRASSLADTTMQRAGIGRGDDFAVAADIRSDRISWLATSESVEAAYLHLMESLREGLNQRLFLGLFDYESHFAHYPPGAYYQRHQDAFRGQSNRILSTVCYLNNEWAAADGGQLLIYQDEQLLAQVEPEMGSLVIFLSERFPHEVLAARRERYSIAGWFRGRQ
ncbi:MAG: 2OG-Fe(II) oxygenase [Spongiibacteraceae bacterium]